MPRQLETGLGVVLEGEHDLEEGVPGHRPRRVEDLHQLLERHVLVRERRQVRLPDPTDQLTEGRVRPTGRCAAPAC